MFYIRKNATCDTTFSEFKWKYRRLCEVKMITNLFFISFLLVLGGCRGALFGKFLQIHFITFYFFSLRSHLLEFISNLKKKRFNSFLLKACWKTILNSISTNTNTKEIRSDSRAFMMKAKQISIRWKLTAPMEIPQIWSNV